jgi:O-antigen/teichoic acid export membrane protein
VSVTPTSPALMNGTSGAQSSMGSLRRDYATSFLAEGLFIGSYLLTFKVVALRMGGVGFGEFALTRRMLTVLAPVAVLGVDMAIARFLASHAGPKDEPLPKYTAAAVVVLLTAVMAVGVVLLASPDTFALLFFGSRLYKDLIYPLPLLLLGNGLYCIAYADLRGRFRVQRANLLMVVNYALVPLVCTLVIGRSVEEILFGIGVGWMLVSGAFVSVSSLRVANLVGNIRKLAFFGIQRVPHDLLQLGLFALPGMWIARVDDIAVAGIVAFGVAGLGMVGASLAPVQFLLLPLAARLLSGGRMEELRRHLLVVVSIAVVVLCLGIAVIEVFADQVVRLFLDVHAPTAVLAFRLILLAMLPWGLQVSLRSVIDAHHVLPVNARNVAIAFGVSLVVTLSLQAISQSGWAVIVGFVVSLYVLAGLTGREVIRIVGRGGQGPRPVHQLVTPMTPRFDSEP